MDLKNLFTFILLRVSGLSIGVFKSFIISMKKMWCWPNTSDKTVLCRNDTSTEDVLYLNIILTIYIWTLLFETEPNTAVWVWISGSMIKNSSRIVDLNARNNSNPHAAPMISANSNPTKAKMAACSKMDSFMFFYDEKNSRYVKKCTKKM